MRLDEETAQKIGEAQRRVRVARHEAQGAVE